jgi:hypothetical protein
MGRAIETYERGLALLWGEKPETEDIDDAAHGVPVCSALLLGAERANFNGRTGLLHSRKALWLRRQEEQCDRSASR